MRRLDFAAGFTVVDDSYNSNPRSLISMVRTIAEAGDAHKRRIVIAGEMLELGPDAEELHREAGREIARLGVDVLVGRSWPGGRIGRRSKRGWSKRNAVLQ